MTTPDATELSGTLVFLATVVSILLAAGVGVGPELRSERQDDGSVKVSGHGVHGGWVVLYGLVSLVSVPSAVANGLSSSGWLWIPIAVAAVAVFVYRLCDYQTRFTVLVTPGSAALGEAIQARWTVTAPVHVLRTGAALAVREHAKVGPRDPMDLVTTVLHEIPVGADGVAVIPASAVPTISAGPNAVSWSLVMTAEFPLWPFLRVEVPLQICAAMASGAPRPVEPTAVVAPHAARLAVTLDGDHRSFAPGEAIGGVIAWERAETPRHAMIRLICEAEAMRTGEVHRVSGHELAVESLPRVFAHRIDDPYRSAGEGETRALAASECRRFRFVAPEGPPSYTGALFRVRWRLEVVVDDDSQAVELVIGPGREAVLYRARAGSRANGRSSTPPHPGEDRPVAPG